VGCCELLAQPKPMCGINCPWLFFVNKKAVAAAKAVTLAAAMSEGSC
jgi:hypothetical protein